MLKPARGRKLRAAEDMIAKTQQEFAETVRGLGICARIREMGLTPEAIRRRVLKILGPG